MAIVTANQLKDTRAQYGTQRQGWQQALELILMRLSVDLSRDCFFMTIAYDRATSAQQLVRYPEHDALIMSQNDLNEACELLLDNGYTVEQQRPLLYRVSFA